MPFINLLNFRLTKLAPMAVAASSICALAAVLPQHANAQTPRPIDPTAAVSTQPLDASQSTSGNADSNADAAARAGYERRQKVLDQRTSENDYRYGVKQHDCYSKFFVNHCLDNARTEMRETRQQIRQEQLALNDEQRAERVQERDRQTALKQAQYDAEAPQRAANERANQQAYEDKQRQNALAAAQRNAEAPQRAANQKAFDQKQADYQKKLDDARARGVQDAQEREQKAQRFEQKQQEAAQHRAEVEARQKEAARKQQEKAQQAQQDQLKQQQQQQQQQQQGK
ncbi:colicin transporter [Burkholderia sp. 8Y]|uniref:colicin transporter n=1 Tax=Burkholderia sp. 8Y TaxID=2653133 RepID=UPI001F2DA785|nr:colicin transporter [Burkholderia sp. 8Y]